MIHLESPDEPCFESHCISELYQSDIWQKKQKLLETLQVAVNTFTASYSLIVSIASCQGFSVFYRIFYRGTEQRARVRARDRCGRFWHVEPCMGLEGLAAFISKFNI